MLRYNSSKYIVGKRRIKNHPKLTLWNQKFEGANIGVLLFTWIVGVSKYMLSLMWISSMQIPKSIHWYTSVTPMSVMPCHVVCRVASLYTRPYPIFIHFGASISYLHLLLVPTPSFRICICVRVGIGVHLCSTNKLASSRLVSLISGASPFLLLASISTTASSPKKRKMSKRKEKLKTYQIIANNNNLMIP